MAGHKNIDRICLIVTILSVVLTILFMNGERLGLRKLHDDPEVLAAENGVPAVYINVDPEEFSKVIEQPEHKYKAEDASVCIALPEGYEGEFGRIDMENIGIDLPLEYMRGRGNATWQSNKKSFKIKLEERNDLLGMGSSKVWLLISNVYDPSLLRNRIMLRLGRDYGLAYTAKCVPVDLYVNGESQGSYILSQAVRIGEAEVDIDEIDPDARFGSEITGGYLIAMSPYPKEKTGNTFTTDRGVRFRLKDPIFEAEKEGDEVGTEEQRDYITGYLQSTEDAIFGDDGKDENGVSWTEYMDMETAAKYWWHQQLCENPDAYRSDSTDLYKDRKGKLYWGPPWDYDIALDPATYNGSLSSISMSWLNQLRANDAEFQQALLDAWEELDPLLDEYTKDGGVIDTYAEEIASSWEQDNEVRQTGSAAKATGLDTQVIQLKHYIDRKRKAINAGLDQISEVGETSSQSQSSQDESSSDDQTVPGAQPDDIGSGISGTCYWRIDSEGNMTIGPTDGSEGTLGTWADAYHRPWHQYKNSITSVSFKGTVHAQTCLAMFHSCYHLKEIDLSGLDTGGVTVMRAMFSWCWSLEELDVSGLDTSDASTTREMFLACDKLRSLDLTAFDLSNVTDMRNMFFRCHHLEKIAFPKSSGWAVENMCGMFGNCFALRSLDLSMMDTSKVTNMRALFYRCGSLHELDLSSMDTSAVTAMDHMFAECSSLESLDLGSFDTSNVTDMSCMFLACEALTQLDLSSFDISAAEDMYCMFGNCSSLEKLTTGKKWKTELDMEEEDVFHGCPLLRAN